MSGFEEVFLLGAAAGVVSVAVLSLVGRKLAGAFARNSQTVRDRLQATDEALVRRLDAAINNPVSAALSLAKTNLLFLLMLSAIYVFGFFRNTFVEVIRIARLSDGWKDFVEVAARCTTGTIVIFLLWIISYELRFFFHLHRIVFSEKRGAGGEEAGGGEGT